MTSYFKIKNFRSRDYLQFIREHNCLACGSQFGVQAAHESGGFNNSGTAIKAPDTQTLPLCGKDTCHPAHHRNPKKFWKKINIDPKVEMIRFLTEYIRGFMFEKEKS